MISFVGYVNSLVVESEILQELPTAVLTQDRIHAETADVIEATAGEKPTDARKREQDENDLKILERVLATLKESLTERGS